MDTYINTDDALLQTKSDLSKEYFYLKQTIQIEKEENDNSNLVGNSIYDLVDKQYLLIQELFKKYSELKLDHSMKKMLMATKANVLKEVHVNVLNRLLEKNYHQENEINELTKELNQFKKKEQIKMKDPNLPRQAAFIPINTEELLFTERKNKAINIYKYYIKNKLNSNSTLNSSATSNSNLITESSSREMKNTSSKKAMKINSLKVKLNLLPKHCLKKNRLNK